MPRSRSWKTRRPNLAAERIDRELQELRADVERLWQRLSQEPTAGQRVDPDSCPCDGCGLRRPRQRS